MPQDTTIPQPRVRRAGPLALLIAGWEAFNRVPGLWSLLVKGFLLMYGLFAVLGLLGWGLLYRFVIGPLARQLGGDAGADAGLWASLLGWLVDVVVWVAQVALLGATLLLAFFLTLALLAEWFEALAARVVRHRRGGAAEEAPFRIGALLRSVGRSLRDSAVLLALAVLALLLGFLPLVGPFLAIGINSYLMGWEVREPYLAVRESLGDDVPALRRGLRWWTAWVGLLPVVVAMVPVVGWLLLPVVLAHMVAGVAWSSEGPGR